MTTIGRLWTRLASGNRAAEAPRAQRYDPRAHEPGFPLKKIALLVAAIFLYTASPIDLIPDFIPVIGWLDDLLVNGGLLALILRAVARYYLLKKRW